MRQLINYWAVVLILMASGACTHVQRPNVLFMVSDDLNTDLGCYGHPMVQSPNIDRLAKRGVRFERAYCQYPVCNPSRTSFLTGLYPEQTRVLDNAKRFRDHLPDVVTLPQFFRHHGYFTSRVGKLFHYGVPNDIGAPGLDDPASWNLTFNPRGRDKVEEDKIFCLTGRSFGGTLSWLASEGDDAQQTDGIGAADAIKLLQEHHDKPFFLAVGFYRPHTPYVSPRKYFDLYPIDKIKLPQEPADDRDNKPALALADRPGQRDMSDDLRRQAIQAYYASISFMDAQVGRVINSLDRLGLADNTIIVFTSDHGYHLADHGLWQKQDLYEKGVRVPMIIVDPRQRNSAGRSSSSLGQLLDLYPTLADLAELSPPPHLMGKSLAPVLGNPHATIHEAAYTVAYAGGAGSKRKGQRVLGRSVRTERYRYTQWGDGGEHGQELYDYQSDPGEFRNLAADPAHAQMLSQLRKLLEETAAPARSAPAGLTLTQKETAK